MQVFVEVLGVVHKHWIEMTSRGCLTAAIGISKVQVQVLNKRGSQTDNAEKSIIRNDTWNTIFKA